MLNDALARGLAAVCLGLAAATAAGAPADDFKAADAKAEAAARQAHALHDEWIVVEDQHKWTPAQRLALARAQADAGRYDEAIRTAREVEALSQAEIAQAESQARDWPRAMVR